MTTIESSLSETRRFPPPAAFAARANLGNEAEYHAMWTRAKDDPNGFWAEQAKRFVTWSKPFDKVLDWQPPRARWFDGGELNASYNCLDRHLATKGDKAALIWEGEPGETRRITYRELHSDVCRFASGLKSLGLAKGDRVTIYMPLVPELVVAVLACARIGATHSVVFGGFSAEAISERNRDAGSKLVITADGGWRKGAQIPLKDNVDQALTARESKVERVVVLKRTGQKVAMRPDRDVWWDDITSDRAATCDATALPSEHPLFILYTSGSTGKPKGILHTTGGYLLGAAMTSHYVLDLKDDDVYWCTADVGWVTGHSYVVYGPLALGATVFLYEGAPNAPDWGRFWAMIERHSISVLYTAPTAIRAFMRQGPEWPAKYDLKTLRLLGSVGEPINPEAWMWYRETIGGNRCPIVDTYWQTETGAIMLAPLPGITATPPGSATIPFFGIDPAVVDKDGREVPPGEGGFLVMKRPWPSMARTIWGDDERFRQTYFSQVPGAYFTGDGARRDKDGNVWIMGRVDDVLNVSGHRLSTMEIESALVSHPLVAEAAVVGAPHDVKGEAIHAFVTVKGATKVTPELAGTLQEHVTRQIGALARPEQVRFAEALPKTRSGKIMRRLLRDIAAGRESKGDVTTLEDLSVLAALREAEE